MPAQTTTTTEAPEQGTASAAPAMPSPKQLLSQIMPLADLSRIVNTLIARREELRDSYIERDDVILGMQIALVTGHPILLVGPKGEAKSALSRALCATVAQASYFEDLGHPYTKPEDWFGPLLPTALQEGRYERDIDGYLPSAHVALLDELFKVSPSMHNTALGIVNERQYKHGKQMIPVPLLLCIAASNELPQAESRVAFFDRLLLRYHIGMLSDAGHREYMDLVLEQRAQMAQGADVSGRTTSHTITPAEVKQLQQAVHAIGISPRVLAGWYTIRDAARGMGIEISSRRARWCLDAIAAHAMLNGRLEATEDDLAILAHTLWDDEEQIIPVHAMVTKIAEPKLSEALKIADAITARFDTLMSKAKDKNLGRDQKIIEQTQAVGDIEQALIKLDEIGAQLRGEKRDDAKVQDIYRRAYGLFERAQKAKVTTGTWEDGRRAPAPPSPVVRGGSGSPSMA